MGAVFYQSCDYLDVVPDNVATVEHAFSNRYEAEQYLFGCYSYLPNQCHIANNPALLGGDEVWVTDPIYHNDNSLWKIAWGEMGANEPLANYWGARKGGKALWRGIRDCNIFLENIHLPYNLKEEERKQWVAEVKFLKAYLHFYLLRNYGPIPIVDKNLDVATDIDKVQVYREPVDKVVEAIVGWIDEALPDLLERIDAPALEAGRITKPIALAVKGQVLLLAASPLFNGNPDYANFVDNRGLQLIPDTYDQGKWEKAAEALKAAIEASHSAGHELYSYKNSLYAPNLNDSTIYAMGTRGAVTVRFPENPEIIWGDFKNSTDRLQGLSHPWFVPLHGSGGNVFNVYAPTLRVVEQFYSANGVPIEEDISWKGVDKYALKSSDESDRFYMKKKHQAPELHFNREPRFYGAICFDGGTFYGNGQINSDDNLNTTDFIGGAAGMQMKVRGSTTGYLVKKLISYQTTIKNTGQYASFYRYAWPIIRLADLYLMYAEALNESKPDPDPEVYEYIDLVRERSGLEGVKESWSKYTTNKTKPLTQEGMRDIIQRERLNELAFEGVRFYDLRRWKQAEEYMNKPIEGWNVGYQEDITEYYKKQELFQLSFTSKDYLWPIRVSDMLTNSNLVQNPGWN